MIQCKKCGCYPKGNECHVCSNKVVPGEEKKKYKRIRPRTVKRAAQERKYLIRVKVFLMLNKKCAVFPNQPSNQVHHKKGRIGDLLLDEKYWLAVSQDGHDKINNNSAWAEENGFTVSRLATNEKNKV